MDHRTKTDLVGTIAGRVGIAFSQTLLFAKGGLAFARDRHWNDGTVAALTLLTFATDRYWRFGWMLGGGAEQALEQNWSFKAEYNFLNLGSRNPTFCNVMDVGDCFNDFRIKQHIHIVKVGINYRW